ncbi:MAG: Gfo/Idh/MocA family oxidoreductase [Nocardiopsaceae bacterium]|jgi:predicted dehydrogenase|nr:Gfo/Idh/MocA family oxidoreductase [Nocardiopsaceae bacterium]
MATARFGLIGLGWWGGVLTAAARASGAAEVVTCYARSPEARATFAAKNGCRAAESLDALLDDQEVDGVLIATPHTTHADLIARAAAAGRHIFVEKPLALTVAEARSAIDAAERAGVILQVGQNARRQPAIRRIKAMLEAGDLGTVLQLEGNRSGPAAHAPGLAPWRADPAESPAGAMAAMGSHVVDTLHYLAGPASRVFAFSVDRLDVRPIDDATAVTIEYESGPLGYIGTSYFVPALNWVAAYGTDASAWSEEDGARFYLQQRADPARAEQPVSTIDTIADELGEFAACVLGEGVPETGAAEGLEVAAVMEAIMRSVRDGCAVQVADLR